MVVLGMEIYRVAELPENVRARLPEGCSPDAIVVKRIVQKSPIRVEWELLESSPSDWLMKDFPADLVKQ